MFSRSADHVVFSYPLRQDDQRLRPSALIDSYPEVTPAELALTATVQFSPVDRLAHPNQQQQQAPLEMIDTAKAPPISAAEQQHLRGGSAILTNQSLCPFSAFAIHRLGARPLDRAQTGLSHADRGNLLHHVLEQIWRQLGSQQQLLELPADALTQLLNHAVGTAIEPFRRRVPRWMGQRFWQLEQRRLTVLTERWLELERQRPAFKVAAVEKSLNTDLLGMPMRLRIDRVDRLDDGSELLIDYKTGSPSVTDWFSDRPRQPQLPLYSYATRNPVSALAFGQVNAGEVAFKGITCELSGSSPASGIKPLSGYRNAPCQQWQQQTELWRQTLERLMRDFISGEVRVSPLDLNVYQYSQLQPLNRYYDMDRLGSANDPQERHHD
jgi:probable DNA repair protein